MKALLLAVLVGASASSAFAENTVDVRRKPQPPRQPENAIVAEKPVQIEESTNMVVVRDEQNKTTCYVVAPSRWAGSRPLSISCVKD